MAQAPDPGAGARGAGAPRQNKTVKQFGGMNTREGRQAVPDGAFPWLENIQPIGPGNLHSIPGRGQSVTRIPPVPVPPGCTDSTLRGQALVEQQLAFDQTSTITTGGQVRRTSWAYVSPDADCITLIGDGGCGGGNMGYVQTGAPPTPNCCQLNRFLDGDSAVFDHPALIDPDGTHPAVNTAVGASDEPMYLFYSAGPTQTSAYYPDSDTHVTYDDPGPHLLPDVFAKKGNRFYGVHPDDGGAFARHILVYDAQAGGAFLADWSSLAAESVSTMNATDTRLVCLCFNTITGRPSIKKLSLVDGSIMESIDLTDISPTRTFAVDDNLIYVASLVAMYYLDGADLVFVGRLISPSLGAFGGNGMFSGGVFYYGQTGFGSGDTQIYKIVIPCPEDVDNPLIATISTGSTVAAGAAINVTWADILDPTVNDLIALRPAPTGGDLGFTGASLANLPTTGGSGGTLPFTIPALTTPGNYIFQLTRDSGTILIATSNVFTVT